MPWLLAIRKNKTKEETNQSTEKLGSTVRRKVNSRPPGKKLEEKMEQKASKLRFLCKWRAQTHGLQTLSGDVVFLKYLDLYFAEVEATVQLTKLNVIF